jgi:hypothetical protein
MHNLNVACYELSVALTHCQIHELALRILLTPKGQTVGGQSGFGQHRLISNYF